MTMSPSTRAIPFASVSVFVHVICRLDAPSPTAANREREVREALLKLGVTLACAEHAADLIVSVSENETAVGRTEASERVAVTRACVQECIDRLKKLLANVKIVGPKAHCSGGREVTCIGRSEGTAANRTNTGGEGVQELTHQNGITNRPSVQIEAVRMEPGSESCSVSHLGDIKVVVVETLTDVPYLAEFDPSECGTTACWFGGLEDVSDVPYMSPSEEPVRIATSVNQDVVGPCALSSEVPQPTRSECGTTTPLSPCSPLGEIRSSSNFEQVDSRLSPTPILAGLTDGASRTGGNCTSEVVERSGSGSLLPCTNVAAVTAAGDLVATPFLSVTAGTVGTENEDRVVRKRKRSSGATASRPRECKRALDKGSTKRKRSGSTKKARNAVDVGEPAAEDPLQPLQHEIVYVDDDSLDAPPSPPPDKQSKQPRKRKVKPYVSSSSRRGRRYPHRIFVSCHDEEMERVLNDVVCHIGASAVDYLFGRVEKPTHFVTEPDSELTPAVLLARALGIPVLTTQWLQDTITQGKFPEDLENYEHPVFGKRSAPIQGPSPGTDGTTTLSQPRTALATNLSTNSATRCFESDTGCYYNPFLFGVTVFFVSSPHSPLTEFFAEIVRVLGGTVTRLPTCRKLSVIVNLSYGAISAPEEETFKKGEQTSSRVGSKRSRISSALPQVDELVLESQALSFTYPNASLDISNGRKSGMSRVDLNTVLCKDLQNVLKTCQECRSDTVPVVSVEWLIHCIMQGRVVETSPYTVPTLTDDTTTILKTCVASGLLDSAEALLQCVVGKS
ncbi:uncharacterized protein TEOVI_000540400 [Trypanosoma equiperdum]|uniref:BRCT domain-containing protein n=2 Tax=Trypanozoon TaxID=39700 RepID=Q57ZE5_TRYB2|nr:hypothetical protein, conserved [Trypanosoma brucei brucei TREU927]AAX80243.1 hypothetical protein, conserved [Trypanosoma brucei]AAZ10201.1 hypothetical protein, conserved [Trypanosoma brucei brucei TREU927]SCU64923.1 hypothetical protein, conserved [Trypanosoma equiperdum]